MKIEYISGVTLITAENGKCLVQKGVTQTVSNNDTTSIYLAKSLTPSDFDECEKMVEEAVDGETI